MDSMTGKGNPGGSRRSTQIENEHGKGKGKEETSGQLVASVTTLSSKVGSDGPRKGPNELTNVRSRLVFSSGYSIGSKESLVGTGYASLTLGLFSIFRISPFLIFILARQFRKVSPVLGFDRVVCYSILFTWEGVVLVVLIAFGIVLAASSKVTKRWALFLHPFGLIALYLDVFVWISLNIWLHVNWSKYPDLRDHMFYRLECPVAYFTVIYIESIIMGVLYYVYATYFIAVETLIIDTYF